MGQSPSQKRKKIINQKKKIELQKNKVRQRKLT